MTARREPRVGLYFDGSVENYFAPDITAFCDILLRRLIPVFEDIDVEQRHAADEYLAAYSRRDPEDWEDAVEAAYDHAIAHAMRFAEMRDVFVAVGVAGLFHLFEKQVYRHVNHDLLHHIEKPFAHWPDVVGLITHLRRKSWLDGDAPSDELVDRFRHPDLVELQNVANAVKHGQDGPAFKALVASNARVVGKDPELAPYSILRVTITLTAEDVIRYRDAILRFWALRGEFWAPVSAFERRKPLT